MNSDELLRAIGKALVIDHDFPPFRVTYLEKKAMLELQIDGTDEKFLVHVYTENYSTIEGLVKIAIQESNGKIEAIKKLRVLSEEYLDEFLGLKEAMNLVQNSWDRWK